MGLWIECTGGISVNLDQVCVVSPVDGARVSLKFHNKEVVFVSKDVRYRGVKTTIFDVINGMAENAVAIVEASIAERENAKRVK